MFRFCHRETMQTSHPQQPYDIIQLDLFYLYQMAAGQVQAYGEMGN